MNKAQREKRNQKILAIIQQAGEEKTKTKLVGEIAKKYKIDTFTVWRIIKENKVTEPQN